MVSKERFRRQRPFGMHCLLLALCLPPRVLHRFRSIHAKLTSRGPFVLNERTGKLARPLVSSNSMSGSPTNPSSEKITPEQRVPLPHLQRRPFDHTPLLGCHQGMGGTEWLRSLQDQGRK